jgi:hypothetical protein
MITKDSSNMSGDVLVFWDATIFVLKLCKMITQDNSKAMPCDAMR